MSFITSCLLGAFTIVYTHTSVNLICFMWFIFMWIALLQECYLVGYGTAIIFVCEIEIKALKLTLIDSGD